MFTLKLTPMWLFIILILVLIIGTIFGFSDSILEGHRERKSSPALELNLKEEEESLQLMKALHLVPNFQVDLKPALALLIDDTTYLINQMKNLQSDLRTSIDDRPNSTALIDKAIGDLTLKIDALKKVNPIDPLIVFWTEAKDSTSNIKQIALEVPKSIFEGYINSVVNAYTHMQNAGKTVYSKLAKFLDPKSLLTDTIFDELSTWTLVTLTSFAPDAIKKIPIGTPLVSKYDERDSFYDKDGHEEKQDTYMTSKNAYNRAGEIMNFGTDTYKDTYYCSRWLGKSKITGSDGQCGPLSGPQCPDCNGYTRQNPPNPNNVKFRSQHSYDYQNIDSSGSPDYIRKTQIVPPVCPMCPTCPVGACANCGGNGGSGTIGANGQSVVPKPGVTGLANDTVNGVTGRPSNSSTP